jgi:hypothetical protein
VVATGDDVPVTEFDCTMLLVGVTMLVNEDETDAC